MSISWRRGSVTASVTDRSSGHPHFSSLQGAPVVPARRTCPEFGSESISCGSEEDNCAAIVSDKRFSNQTSGTPMKKLLALEMFKENESKRRSPSVIARLMGFDGLPTQQPTCKQHRSSSSGSGQHKTQKSSQSSSRRSSRKSSKDEQEFKDVFEVLDASKMDNSSCSSRGTANSKPLVREKFMGAKRLSADERYQGSKEFDDALEVLEAKKDILLQFLPKPDFLLRKHLHDLQSTTPHPRNIRMHRKEEETFPINHDKYPVKHQGVRYHSYRTCPSPPKPSRYGLQEENDHALLPTRIVVLKPNPGKSFNHSSRTLSPPRSSHHISSDIRKPGEITHLKNRDAEILNKESVKEVGLSGCTSKESRKIAKEITRQMRNNFRRRPTKISNCTLRGYAGDESSCDSSSSESVDESDVLFPRSKDIHDWNKQLRKSSCHTESSVSQESQRRLSQRWKITYASQDLDSTYRSNTLGEMLAAPDSEGRLANFTAEEGYTSRSSSNSIVGTAKEPLGISSRDGWKDRCLSNLSRSRSVPSSSVGHGSPKRSSHHEILCRDKFVIPQEGMKRERNKLVNRNFNQREDSFPRNLRVRGKEAQAATSSAVEKAIDPESCFIYEVDEQDLVSEPSACSLHTTSVHEYMVGANSQSSALLLADCSVESCAPSPLHGDACNGNDIRINQGQLNKAAPDHTASELESHGKPKEGDQPSPISILEAPFTDDASSGSEGFESLSADLHGLRMQLKMLKLESEAYEEGPMFVSSDEDAGKEGYVVLKKKGMLRADSRWESSYILDVLTDSGINDTDPDTFMATWHSPDCPVNPMVFDELEKKYCDQIHECRSNRKLLFDWINSKLLEIHQEYADQHQWMKSSNQGPMIKWCRELDLEDKLLMLLPGIHTRMDMDAGEKALARESKWLELQEDIDLIGREVERWLIDELITEVVAV